MAKTNEVVVDTLIKAGINRGFTLPGLGITWSLPAFYERRDDFEVILTRNEWIASIMAQTTGRLTGKPGLLMGQGPWMATMGAVGIQEAHFAGSPMVVLTETSCYDGYGQKGVYQTMTGDYGGADICASLKPITKYCTYATTPEEAIYGTQLAIKHATLPRQGPTAVVMKTPIIKQEVPDTTHPKLYPLEGHLAYTPARPDFEALKRLAKMIEAAERPIIVAGNGVVSSETGTQLQLYAENAGVAVATSYNGKGVIAETSDIAVGMLGTWGAPTSNRALAEADLVIMLGASMAPDYTRFCDPNMVRPGDQKLVQIDVDPRNAGWVYPVDMAITGDLADVIPMLTQIGLNSARRTLRLEWINAIKERTGYHVTPNLQAKHGTVHHTDIVRSLQEFIGPDDLLTLDAGANRIWTTNALRTTHPGQLLVPGGTGVMGWAPPAAAAAKLVYPEKRITCLAGDGGFMMTLQTLSTCVQHNAPVVFLVSNNSGLGMVRDNLGERRIACDFTNTDFATIAEGMGAKGLRVNHPDQITDALKEAHAMGVPVVIDVQVDPEASYVEAVDSEPL